MNNSIQPVPCNDSQNGNASDSVGTPLYGSPQQPVYSGQYTYVYPSEDMKKPSPRREAFNRGLGTVSLGIAVILSIIFGALYCKFIFRGGFGLGVTVVTLLFYVLFGFIFVKKSRIFSLTNIITLVPTLVLAASFSLNASRNGRFYAILTLIGLFMINTSVLSCCADRTLSSSTLSDSLTTHTIGAIENIGGTCSALFKRGERGTGKERGVVGKVLIGLFISLPVVAILIALFSAADPAFELMVDNFFDTLDIKLGGVVVDIVVGMLLSFYFLPLVLTLRSGYGKERARRDVKRPLDPVIFATIVFASCVVYIAFVAVQFRYLFTGELADYFGLRFDARPALPDGMTWAEYARSGFSEMSFIIIATFIVIALLVRFCRRGGNGGVPNYLSAGLTVISACDAVIALSAAMRMRLYTKWCGLTCARTQVLFAIGIVAVSLVIIIVKLWNDRVRSFALIAAVTVIGVTAFSCMNVDALCARVNVARHLEQGTSIDIEYLGDLSYAAAPSVERLMNESPDENIRNAARGIIANYYFNGQFYEEPMSEHPIGKWTLDHQRAYNIYLKYKPTKDDVDNFTQYVLYEDEVNMYSKLHDDEYPLSYEEFCETGGMDVRD